MIAASQYRNNFRLEKKKGCPSSVITYAEGLCSRFVPHDVFVIDICECGDRYYIVECNCMNGDGFYNAGIEAIVFNVTKYVSEI